MKMALSAKVYEKNIYQISRTIHLFIGIAYLRMVETEKKAEFLKYSVRRRARDKVWYIMSVEIKHNHLAIYYINQKYEELN